MTHICSRCRRPFYDWDLLGGDLCPECRLVPRPPYPSFLDPSPRPPSDFPPEPPASSSTPPPAWVDPPPPTPPGFDFGR